MKRGIGTALAMMAATGIGLAGAVAAPSLTGHASSLKRIAVADDPVTGDWEGLLSVETPQGTFDIDILISLELQGSDVTGTFTVTGPTGESQDVAFEGEWDEDSSTISGIATADGEDGEADCELEIDGDDMTGTVTSDEGPEATISATRSS